MDKCMNTETYKMMRNMKKMSEMRKPDIFYVLKCFVLLKIKRDFLKQEEQI